MTETRSFKGFWVNFFVIAHWRNNTKRVSSLVLLRLHEAKSQKNHRTTRIEGNTTNTNYICLKRAFKLSQTYKDFFRGHITETLFPKLNNLVMACWSNAASNSWNSQGRNQSFMCWQGHCFVLSHVPELQRL